MYFQGNQILASTRKCGFNVAHLTSVLGKSILKKHNDTFVNIVLLLTSIIK